MTSKILSSTNHPNLQPNQLLWSLYHPETAPFRFKAENIDEARLWQTLTRNELARIIGFSDLPRPQIVASTLEIIDCGDYIREKVIIQTSDRILMPVYLLVPKEKTGALPSVIAFHGHGYGVKDIVGLWEDGNERSEPDGYQKDFAVALCRRGFAVAAPEISCFGERQIDFSYLNSIIGQPVPTTCTQTAFLASHLGGTAIGLRVFDGQRLIDFLSERPEFDVNRLGAMGISGGGMHTFYSTCLDLRIKACVISGYYSSFAASILSMFHCPCNFIPGLSKFGEMHDLIGLIAPRPVLIEAATRDPIFPIEAVREATSKARDIYKVFGNPECIENDIFEGRHEISGRRAYDFLWEYLNRDFSCTGS